MAEPILNILTPEGFAAERKMLELMALAPQIAELNKYFGSYPPNTLYKSNMASLIQRLKAINDMDPSLCERILARLDYSGPHWTFTSTNSRTPRIMSRGKSLNVRHFLYSELIGPIDDYEQLHAWCGHYGCLRPSHLTIGQMYMAH